MFDRFTDRARRSVIIAQEHAKAEGRAEADALDLLFGLAREGESLAGQALAELGISADLCGTLPRPSFGPAVDLSGGAPLGITLAADLSAVLGMAGEQAEKLDSPFTGAEHLLLALVAFAGTPAGGSLAESLDRLPAGPGQIVQKVHDLISRYAVPLPQRRPLPAAPPWQPAERGPAAPLLPTGRYWAAVVTGQDGRPVAVYCPARSGQATEAEARRHQDAGIHPGATWDIVPLRVVDTGREQEA